MSSGGRSAGKKSKKIASNSKPNDVSLQDKLKMVDKEERALLKDLDDLKKWTDAIDGMNDEQLKEYLDNRPEELKSVKIQKNKHKPKPKQKVQKVVKNKTSACSGIMASVWKFHKEEEDEDDDDDDDKVTRAVKQTIAGSRVK